jgi:hypothetical protein
MGVVMGSAWLLMSSWRSMMLGIQGLEEKVGMSGQKVRVICMGVGVWGFGGPAAAAAADAGHTGTGGGDREARALPFGR